MYRISESQWVNYFGFKRLPFDRPEAGNEEFARPEFLASCFVEPQSFDRILGQADAPVTALLFAERGSGKTACRVMIDYYCQHGLATRDRIRSEKPAYVLSVPHIHLDGIIWQARRSLPTSGFPRVLIEHHALEIMLRTVPVFATMVAREPKLAKNLREMSGTDQIDLSWLVVKFGHYLSIEQAAFLERLGIGQPKLRLPIGFGQQPSSVAKPASWTADLLQSKAQASLSPLDHIARWAQLLHKIGIVAIYVLVDGVDELEETANNPITCMALLRPLLANLRLMQETPYLALKFFLPLDLYNHILSDNTIRKDRGFIFEEIRLSEEDLIAILHKRLEAVAAEREQTVNSFDALCVPELHGEIEQTLVRLAQKNPRHLMLLCGLMVSMHCAAEPPVQDDPYQLNQADLEKAIARFEAIIGSSHLEINRSNDPLLTDLIAHGETEQVEFKARMRFDIQTSAVNKRLQHKIARSVAGMMNRDGGVLLIGVGDDGNVLGIDDEVLLLAKSTHDRFQLELMDILNEHLGGENMDLVGVRFNAINGKTICVVWITKSMRPVYMRLAGQHEFWLRAGNRTRMLDVRAAQDYIQSHWGARA